MQIRKCTPAEILELRASVLRPGLTAKDVVNAGDDAETTFHLGYFDADKLVSIASFYLENKSELGHLPKPQYRLRGMATADSHRNQGIGAKLLDASVPHLKEKGCKTLWCNARVAARTFYDRFGMSVEGGTFDIPGIGDHWLMWKKI